MSSKSVITSTVYDKRGRVLAVGMNSFVKTHTKQKSYAIKAGLPECIYLHAEVISIIRALKNGIPHKIKVERYYKNGKPALAKPCPICELCIEESGISVIEYTIG